MTPNAMQRVAHTFLQTRFIPKAGSKVVKVDLYFEYVNHCEDTGSWPRLSVREFYALVTARYPDVKESGRKRWQTQDSNWFYDDMEFHRESVS